MRERKPTWFKVPAPGGPSATASSKRAHRGREPAHGLPGGRLPERRRVLGARHRDVHDPRRHVHAPLRVLQRQDRQADLERPAGARARRPLGRPDGPAPRGHHVRRPRRPARLRRAAFVGVDPPGPPPGAELQGRGPHPRLPRPGDAAGQGHRRAPRRLQPQRRGRPAAVPRRAPRLDVGALAARAAERQGHGRRRRRHEVRPDGRPRRDATTRSSTRSGQLRERGVQVITVGQYLRPTERHLPVVRYWHPDEFNALEEAGVRARLRPRRRRPARALELPRRPARPAGPARRRAARRRCAA